MVQKTQVQFIDFEKLCLIITKASIFGSLSSTDANKFFDTLKKENPNEAKLLRQIYDDFKKSQIPDVQTYISKFFGNQLSFITHLLISEGNVDELTYKEKLSALVLVAYTSYDPEIINSYNQESMNKLKSNLINSLKNIKKEDLDKLLTFYSNVSYPLQELFAPIFETSQGKELFNDLIKSGKKNEKKIISYLKLSYYFDNPDKEILNRIESIGIKIPFELKYSAPYNFEELKKKLLEDNNSSLKPLEFLLINPKTTNKAFELLEELFSSNEKAILLCYKYYPQTISKFIENTNYDPIKRKNVIWTIANIPIDEYNIKIVKSAIFAYYKETKDDMNIIKIKNASLLLELLNQNHENIQNVRSVFRNHVIKTTLEEIENAKKSDILDENISEEEKVKIKELNAKDYISYKGNLSLTYAKEEWSKVRDLLDLDQYGLSKIILKKVDPPKKVNKKKKK